ncbi:MAG: glycosyltransferase, partial [Bdellovibrionales bacterium]|nr:glycosyltransferase [Bdellovibrionales bacterium]
NGSTVMRDSLEAEATRLGIGPRLLWLQSPADMVALYSALDVLVSSSDSEGFSNVLTEAMACGVPCVATDVGDSAWILGDTGRIVPPQQTDALAEGIRDILATDPATRGKRARQRIIDNFSIEKMVDATLEAFA